MKKVLLFSAILLSSFLTFSQITISDSQLFGSTRNLAVGVDFGQLSNPIIEKEYIISNPTKADMVITNVDIPEGFGVVIPQKTIKAGTFVKIKVLAYKDYIKEDNTDLMKTLLITTEYYTFDGKVATTQVINLKFEK